MRSRAATGREPERTAAVEPEFQHLDPEAQRVTRLCLSILAALGSASLLGVASSAYIINHYPLLLILLSPIGRHLLLVAPTVNPVAFVAVATLRRLAFYLASFFLGRSAGPVGMIWLENRAGWLARFIHLIKRVYEFSPRAAVILLPGPIMSSVAGLSGMPVRVFALLATTGLVIRMLITVALGELWRRPIEAVLAWIEQYRFEGTLLLVSGALLYQLWQIRARRRALEEASQGQLSPRPSS